VAYMAIEFVDGWLNDEAGVVEYPTQYYEAL
jgi:hypothetical protein